MKIACTGSTGRVGRLLVARHGVVPLVADITDRDAVKRELDELQPHVVIHLAGISDVDYCEKKEHQEQVIDVNFTGALNVIRACDERKILCSYLSTEHVFSGKAVLGLFGGGPYPESTIPTSKVPNYYALTKLAVESARRAFPHMRIVRTSYLFDYPRLFTEEITKRTDTYYYPTFIRRSYMYLPHFVACLWYHASMITTMPDILHIAGSQTVSQYQFMRDLIRMFAPTVTIKPRRRELDDGSLARRPHRGGLDTTLSRKLGFPQYSYKDGFSQMQADNVVG